MVLSYFLKAAIDSAYHGYAKVAKSPYLSNNWAANQDLEPWPYDPARAQELFAGLARACAQAVLLVGIGTMALTANIAAKRIILRAVTAFIERTEVEWDDVFLDANTFKWIGYIPAAVIFCLATEILASDLVPLDLEFRSSILDLLKNVAYGFIVLCIVRATNASLTADTVEVDDDVPESISPGNRESQPGR